MRHLILAVLLSCSHQALAIAVDTATPTTSPTPTASPTPADCYIGSLTAATSGSTYNQMVIGRFTVAQTSVAKSITMVWPTCPNAGVGYTMRVAIYSGTSTYPVTRLSISPATVSALGIMSIDIPDVTLSPGNDYWWAFYNSDPTALVSMNSVSGNIAKIAGWPSSGGLPATAPDISNFTGAGTDYGLQINFCNGLDISPTITPTPSTTPTISSTPTISLTHTITETFTISQTPTIAQTSTITPTFSISPTLTAVCQVGDFSNNNTSMTVTKNTIFSMHFTVPQNVQLTALRFNQRYCYGNPLYVGIYQGTASDPSVLLGQVATTTGSGGAEVYDQSVINLPDMDLQAGAHYWVAFVIGGGGSNEIFTGSNAPGAEDLWNNGYTAGPLPVGTYDKGSGGGSGVNINVQYIFCGYVDGSPTTTRTSTKTETSTSSPTHSSTATRTATPTVTATPSRTMSFTSTETQTPVEVVTAVVPNGTATAVALTDGTRVSLTAGAFSAPVTITMERYTGAPVPAPDSTQFSLLGVVYEINAGGATLLQPATITFPYDPVALAATGRPASALRVGYYNGSVWTQISGTINTVAHTITITTTHFSIWGVGVKAADPASAIAAPAGVSGFFVNPVIRRGQGLCAYPAKALSESRWELYNLAGDRVSELKESGSTVCLDTAPLAPGLYYLRARSTFADGSASEDLKKIVLLP